MKAENTQIFLILIDEKIEKLEEKHEIMRKTNKKYGVFQIRLEKVKNDLEYWVSLRSEVFNSIKGNYE